MKKTSAFAIFMLLSGGATADQVKSLSELALLPPYCAGTQQVRTVSKDPKPIAEYIAIYGQPYNHLHHYCWALNAENNAWRIRDRFLRKSKLGYALGDIQYVLDRSGPDFVLLPEILNTQARILFSLKRDSEAAIALNKAISIKPDYAQAYERLSDYYVDTGNKAQAIAILERGIGNTEKATRLIKRLAKLGKTYPGVPGDMRAVKSSEDDTTKVETVPANNENSALSNSPPETMEQSSSSSGENKPPSAADTQPKSNPYCRFCP